MPPDQAVIESVPTDKTVETQKAPVVNRGYKEPTAGDKYREAFAKLEKPNSTDSPVHPVTEPDSKSESPVKPDASVDVPTTPTQKSEEHPPASKPSSPLEAAIGEVKPEPPKEEALPEKLEGATDKVNENWKRARGTIESLKAEVAKLKSTPPPKVEDNGYAALQKEHEALQARYNDQETRLKAINAEYSDEYRQLVSEREGIVNKIGKRVDAFGGDKDRLVAALSLPEGKVKSAQIKEAMSELDSDDKARIHTLIETLDAHDEKINGFKADLPGQWDRMIEQRELQERQFVEENLKNLESEFGKIAQEIPKNSVTLREVPEDVPGSEDWNSEVRSARESALSILKPGAEFSKTVDVALKGSRYDSLEKRYLELYKEHGEAMKRLKEYENSGPDFTGTPQSKVPKKEESGSSRYHKALAQIRSAEQE